LDQKISDSSRCVEIRGTERKKWWQFGSQDDVMGQTTKDEETHPGLAVGGVN